MGQIGQWITISKKFRGPKFSRTSNMTSFANKKFLKGKLCEEEKPTGSE